jgi:LacI family transcriptional regulator
MATIYEVSELAGVSLATVSRVINDSGVVSPKTRDKVIEAMRELGYRPNTIAQSLATKRSNSVGVLIPELYGPFFGVILSSIEDELRTESKHVIITAGHSDEAIEKDGIEFLSSRNCDALILHVYAVSDEYIEQLRESNIPIVVIGRSVRRLPLLPARSGRMTASDVLRVTGAPWTNLGWNSTRHCRRKETMKRRAAGGE